MATDLLSVLGDENDDGFHLKVVTSLLRYLVDPHADHGIGAALLKELLHDASQSWPAIDQDLVDSVACYPGIPDLDIEVSDAGGGGFIVGVRYETSLFAVGVQTVLPGVPPADVVEEIAKWSSLLADFYGRFSSVRTSRITKHHRGVVWVGPFVKMGKSGLSNVLTRTYEWANIDALHHISWRMSERQSSVERRSVQELIGATIEQVVSGYVDGASQQTVDLLRRLHHAIGTSFRFDQHSVHLGPTR